MVEMSWFAICSSCALCAAPTLSQTAQGVDREDGGSGQDALRLAKLHDEKVHFLAKGGISSEDRVLQCLPFV